MVDHTDLFILRALCEQLSPVERLLEKAHSTPSVKGVQALAARLLRLVEEGLVDSYLLHAEHPFITPVETNAAGIYKHWFFISKEGVRLLMDLHPSPISEGRPHRLRQRGTRVSRLRDTPEA